jgi:hypothetical protein
VILLSPGAKYGMRRSWSPGCGRAGEREHAPPPPYFPRTLEKSRGRDRKSRPPTILLSESVTVTRSPAAPPRALRGRARAARSDDVTWRTGPGWARPPARSSGPAQTGTVTPMGEPNPGPGGPEVQAAGRGHVPPAATPCARRAMRRRAGPRRPCRAQNLPWEGWSVLRETHGGAGC